MISHSGIDVSAALLLAGADVSHVKLTESTVAPAGVHPV